MALERVLEEQRFGFGPRPGLPSWRDGVLGGPDPALRLYPGASGAEALARRNAMQARLIEARARSASDLSAARKLNQGELAELHREGIRRALARAVDTPDGYRERLVRFWADHFSIIARDPKDQPRLQPYVDEAIRPHLTGPFAGMLRAAILHPMMLVYLDQARSVGPRSGFGQRRGRGLNENLARELLELHSLGVAGGYSQSDVRELAKLLTGLGVSRDGVMGFFPDRAEPGAETVFGKSYGGARPALRDIEALLDDLAVHPATARHLAAKLATHFVADVPPEGLVADLTALWRSSDGDLGRVQRALFEHPLARGRALQKARQPFDFLAAALRALEISGAEIMAWNGRSVKFTALDPLREMAQPWEKPPGPDGWEEDLERWITPQALARRVSWAMRLPARLRPDLPDARAFLSATLPWAEAEIGPIIARAETNIEGVGLVLASPQFNRR